MSETTALDTILKLAGAEAAAGGQPEILPGHLLVALSKACDAEGAPAPAEWLEALRQEFESLGIEPRRFRRRMRGLLRRPGPPASSFPKLSQAAQSVLAIARLLVSPEHRASEGRYLLRALLAAPWDGGCPASPAESKPVAEAPAPASASLAELTRRLRALRQKLRARVYGQDHAIEQFLDGLFNVEVARRADSSRRKPAGLFLFAGPPGVGKTYLAELAADDLGRPYTRFDMSSYAHGSDVAALIGQAPVYTGAAPGLLTGFVREHPDALLLFDEVEKSHHTAIHLFLQILDAGRLEDKYTSEQVAFRDTILIFTTNVGRSLYENQNSSGVHQANAGFHRATILDALRTEVDPQTRAPFFPEAICSRLATGYPILFHRLQVRDLSRIAASEMERIAGLIEQEHGPRCQIASQIPLAVVMREGAGSDARTIRAQAEAFLKQEIFKACRLFSDQRIDEALARIGELSLGVDLQHAGAAAGLFEQGPAPSVLYAGNPALGGLLAEMIPEVTWFHASSADQACEVPARCPVDFVLLDLSYPGPGTDGGTATMAKGETLAQFDFASPSARRFTYGQRILQQLHTRLPEVPVYLFSIDGAGPGQIDEELLQACVRAGGARGAVRTLLGSRVTEAWEAHRDALAADLESLARELRLERHAAELARQNQVVTFDTAPLLSPDGARLQIRCRNFRTVRAVRSQDAGGVLADAERPNTTFADVIGAGPAKQAMGFLRDWLQDPRKYAAAGIEPPRGVLLTGPPGTGKTMLARALAGESRCAFLVEAATNFVTKYTGSGPEAIRNLYARARRYAPSIVFIDEIDAIGGNRADVKTGFVGHAEGMTLNQLLTEMDGFSKSPSSVVITIAATNHAEKLDPALLRRFSRVIEVDLPDRAERELYLRRRLEAKGSHQVSRQMIERIGAQSQGRSVADLERVLAEASLMALNAGGVITDAILSEAFEKITLGEARPQADPLRTARHEAGHALLMCELGAPPVYVTIVGRGNFGGYAAFEDAGPRGSRTRKDLEALIAQMLAGREAERIFYQGAEADSTGPSNDLERATGLAEAMVYDYGMSPEIGFLKVDRRRPLAPDLAGRCQAAVRAILEEQSSRASAILTARRPALERVAQALVERNRLLKDELLALVAGEAA